MTTDPAAFYDRWTPTLLAHAGTTFQGGLIKPSARSAPPTPESSTLYLARRAGIQHGDRILDAGCGVCGPAIAIANAVYDVRVDAVTVSRVQVDIAGDLIDSAGLADRVYVWQADFHELPFDDNTFDVVLFFEVTGYSPNRMLMFKEARRVLKHGGTVYVKDLFRREEVSDTELRKMTAFDRLWGLASTPTISRLVGSMLAAGLVDISADEFPYVDMEHYYDSMRDDSGGLNEFGKAFLHRADIDVSAGLPVLFGEVKGHKA